MANYNKTYDLLSEISSQLLTIEDDEIGMQRLEEFGPELQKAINEDFEAKFGSSLIFDQTFQFYNDSTHRQSATSSIFKVHLKEDEQFKLYIETLIGHQKFWIKVKNKTFKPDSLKLSARIESKQNVEGFAEFRTII